MTIAQSYRQGRWRDVVENTLSAENHSQLSLDERFMIADSWFHLSDWEAALQHLDILVTREGRHLLDSWKRRSQIFATRGNWREVCKPLRDKRIRSEDDAELAYCIGVALWNVGQRMTAIELWKATKRVNVLSEAALVGRLQSNLPFHRILEKRVFSQNGEDGILSRILDELEVVGGYTIEVGFGARENNTLFSCLTRGLGGIFVDSRIEVCAEAEIYFSTLKRYDLTVLHSLVTPDRIDSICEQRDLVDGFQVLSIDVDGDGIWLLNSLQVSRPKVIIIEMNAHLGPLVAVSQRAVFADGEKVEGTHGASLAALCKVANRLGYNCVGCDSTGTNAFFVRSDLTLFTFHSMTPAEAFGGIDHLVLPLSALDNENWVKW